MFVRSSKSAFVCLTCRSKLARNAPDQPRLQVAGCVRALPALRRQSTAAATIEDDYEQTDDQRALVPRPAPKRKRKNLKRSVWRPDRVAQLGVSSLGKPAEVLLLDERDRIIPQVPPEPEKENQHEVLDSLNSENTPLSPEQVKDNIEQIRSQVGQNRGPLEAERWKQVRQGLWKGFSQTQLRNYVEQMQSEAAKPFQGRPRKLGWGIKQQIAHYIAKHIWGFSGPDSAEGKKPAEVETSEEMKVPGYQLDVLLLQENSALGEISDRHKVRVDFFREPAKIVLSGASASVKAARGMFEALRRRVRKTRLAIPGYEEQAPSIHHTELFQRLRQRYRVHISSVPLKSAVDVYYHEDREADIGFIRRHLLLNRETRQIPVAHTFWPHSPSETLTTVPYSGPLHASIRVQDRWTRFARADGAENISSMAQMTSEQKASFKAVYEAVRKALQGPLQLSDYLRSGSGRREERTAYFGQAIFQDSKRATTLPNERSPLPGKFVSEIPLLPQFLAKRKTWRDEHMKQKASPAGERSPEIISTSSITAPYHFRIVLKPLQSQIPLPELEVLLSGAKFANGLKQPLQIKRVTAKIEDRESYLLLPTRAVDIRFQREVKQDLYVAGSSQGPHDAELLAQLAEYLSLAEGLSEPTFAPSTMLRIPKGLRLAVSMTRGGKNADSATRRKGDAVKTKHRDPTAQEYILASANALDIASFQPPFLSKLCLDHIVYMGDQWEGDWQELRLSEQSLLSKISVSRPAFAAFFNSAYEIALLLGDPALLKSA